MVVSGEHLAIWRNALAESCKGVQVTHTQISRILDTSDVDEARTVIAAGYCEHRLAVSRAGKDFRAVQDEWRVGKVRMHRLTYGVDVAIEASPLGESILVSTPVTGVLTVTTGEVERRYGPGEVVTIGPDHPFRLRWEKGCALRTIQVDRQLLGAKPEILEPDSVGPSRSIALPPQHQCSKDDARLWHMVGALLEAQAVEGARTDLVVDRIEALVAATLVARKAPLSPVNEVRSPRPRCLQAAIDFVEAHADQPIAVAEMADAAHMSVRAFQYSLRRHTGLTPSELLRGIRLERSYRDLVAAKAEETNVAKIAHRWGFSNLGRFSRYYAERFGELPSKTLHR